MLHAEGFSIEPLKAEEGASGVVKPTERTHLKVKCIRSRCSCMFAFN